MHRNTTSLIRVVTIIAYNFGKIDLIFMFYTLCSSYKTEQSYFEKFVMTNLQRKFCDLVKNFNNNVVVT